MSDDFTEEDWRATLAAAEGLSEDAEEKVASMQLVMEQQTLRLAGLTAHNFELVKLAGNTARAKAEADFEAARLRKLIEDAPHDHYETCGPTNYLISQGATEDELLDCTCWKSKALTGQSE
jgi:hypothetical protein